MGVSFGNSVRLTDLWLMIAVVCLWTGDGRAQQVPAPLPEVDRQFDPSVDQLDQVTPLPPSPAETLDDAWHIALTADQRVAASRWSISSAESTRAAAQAELYPALQLGASYYALSDQPNFNLNSPLGAFETPFVNQEGTAFQATVKQPLYTFGRITNGINAAEEAVHASQADCNKTRLDVKMNVAEVYIQNLRSAKMIEVTESRAKSLEAHNEDVARFFEKGLVSKNDLLAAQVALADARQQVLQAKNLQQIARASYNRALGRELDTTVGLAELEEPGEQQDLSQLTNQAIQMRPELATLAAQARGLRDQAASVRAKSAPQVGVQGGYLSMQNDYVTPDGVAAVILGVEWTPMDCGRVSNQASSLSEKAESVIRMRKDAESMIALEVRQKWLDLQTAQERLKVMRQATHQADENVRVARDRYQQQVGTNTEVLDAESLRMQTYINFYNSHYEVVLAELRLRRAVGSL